MKDPLGLETDEEIDSYSTSSRESHDVIPEHTTVSTITASYKPNYKSDEKTE